MPQGYPLHGFPLRNGWCPFHCSPQWYPVRLQGEIHRYHHRSVRSVYRFLFLLTEHHFRFLHTECHLLPPHRAHHHRFVHSAYHSRLPRTGSHPQMSELYCYYCIRLYGHPRSLRNNTLPCLSALLCPSCFRLQTLPSLSGVLHYRRTPPPRYGLRFLCWSGSGGCFLLPQGYPLHGFPLRNGWCPFHCSPQWYPVRLQGEIHRYHHRSVRSAYRFLFLLTEHHFRFLHTGCQLLPLHRAHHYRFVHTMYHFRLLRTGSHPRMSRLYCYCCTLLAGHPRNLRNSILPCPSALLCPSCFHLQTPPSLSGVLHYRRTPPPQYGLRFLCWSGSGGCFLLPQGYPLHGFPLRNGWCPFHCSPQWYPVRLQGEIHRYHHRSVRSAYRFLFLLTEHHFRFLHTGCHLLPLHRAHHYRFVHTVYHSRLPRTGNHPPKSEHQYCYWLH